jgi:hypothetical protein
MKKINILVLALCSGLMIHAQSSPQLTTPMAAKTRFGIRGGANLSEFHVNRPSFSMNNAPNTQMRTSYVAGAFVNIPLGSGGLKFQPEVDFSSQGSKLTWNNSTNTYEARFHYWNVPLVFQYQTPGGFFVELGPQVGLIQKGEIENPGSNNGSGAKMEITDQLHKADFSGVGGIGYMTRVGLAINARYLYGFSNIIKEENQSPTTYFGPGKMQNRVIQLSLSYAFGAYK